METKELALRVQVPWFTSTWKRLWILSPNLVLWQVIIDSSHPRKSWKMASKETLTKSLEPRTKANDMSSLGFTKDLINSKPNLWHWSSMYLLFKLLILVPVRSLQNLTSYTRSSHAWRTSAWIPDWHFISSFSYLIHNYVELSSQKTNCLVTPQRAYSWFYQPLFDQRLVFWSWKEKYVQLNQSAFKTTQDMVIMLIF